MATSCSCEVHRWPASSLHSQGHKGGRGQDPIHSKIQGRSASSLDAELAVFLDFEAALDSGPQLHAFGWDNSI